MKSEGYGRDYKYAHDFENNFVFQEFMPDSLAGKKFYNPNTTNATEQKIAARMTELWGEKYK
jgi:putative ATPase